MQGAAEGAMALPLHKCSSLVLQDRQGLFQTVDLSIAPALALFVALRLRDASLLDLRVEIEHSAQLGLCCLTVARVLGDSRIACLELLGLVLDVLVLGGLGHGILLADLLVLGLGICLFGLLLGQVAREIGL